jgi:hypothetical protein
MIRPTLRLRRFAKGSQAKVLLIADRAEFDAHGAAGEGSRRT